MKQDSYNIAFASIVDVGLPTSSFYSIIENKYKIKNFYVIENKFKIEKKPNATPRIMLLLNLHLHNFAKGS